jgi:hypothetical protein
MEIEPLAAAYPIMPAVLPGGKAIPNNKAAGLWRDIKILGPIIVGCSILLILERKRTPCRRRRASRGRTPPHRSGASKHRPRRRSRCCASRSSHLRKSASPKVSLTTTSHGPACRSLGRNDPRDLIHDRNSCSTSGQHLPCFSLRSPPVLEA